MLLGYKGQSSIEAGYIFCPYIPLQYGTRRTFEEYLNSRRQYLLSCPSHPYTCTGECSTPEFVAKIDKIIERERSRYKGNDPDLPGRYRELDITEQKDCIEILPTSFWYGY